MIGGFLTHTQSSVLVWVPKFVPKYRRLGCWGVISCLGMKSLERGWVTLWGWINRFGFCGMIEWVGLGYLMSLISTVFRVVHNKQSSVSKCFSWVGEVVSWRSVCPTDSLPLVSVFLGSGRVFLVGSL